MSEEEQLELPEVLEKLKIIPLGGMQSSLSMIGADNNDSLDKGNNSIPICLNPFYYQSIKMDKMKLINNNNNNNNCSDNSGKGENFLEAIIDNYSNNVENIFGPSSRNCSCCCSKRRNGIEHLILNQTNFKPKSSMTAATNLPRKVILKEPILRSIQNCIHHYGRNKSMMRTRSANNNLITENNSNNPRTNNNSNNPNLLLTEDDRFLYEGYPSLEILRLEDPINDSPTAAADEGVNLPSAERTVYRKSENNRNLIVSNENNNNNNNNNNNSNKNNNNNNYSKEKVFTDFQELVNECNVISNLALANGLIRKNMKNFSIIQSSDIRLKSATKKSSRKMKCSQLDNYGNFYSTDQIGCVAAGANGNGTPEFDLMRIQQFPINNSSLSSSSSTVASCSQQARINVSTVTTTAGTSVAQSSNSPDVAATCDVTIDELASYFETFVHIPKKMSTMAEMMYI